MNLLEGLLDDPANDPQWEKERGKLTGTTRRQRDINRDLRQKLARQKLSSSEAYRKYQERVARTREERLAFDKAQAEKRDAESQQGSRTIVGGKDSSATATLKMVQGVPGIAKSAVKGIANIARKQALKNPKYAKFENRAVAAGRSAAEREAEARDTAQQKIDKTASAMTRLAKAREKNPNAFSSKSAQPQSKPQTTPTSSSGTTTTPAPSSPAPSTSVAAPPAPSAPQTGGTSGPSGSRFGGKRGGPSGSRFGGKRGGPSGSRFGGMRGGTSGPSGPSGPKFGKNSSSTNESYEYSCWREEFIVELGDMRRKKRKKDEDAPIDKMSGTNNISMYPTVSNENVSYGQLLETTNGASIFAKATPPLKKRTTPMSDVYLSKQPGRGTAEKVEAIMRKLFLGDRRGFTANYDLSLTSAAQDRVNEAYDEENETFRQHSRERFTAGSGDAEHQKRASRTARFLKLRAEMNKDVVPPKKKKKKKKKEGQE